MTTHNCPCCGQPCECYGGPEDCLCATWDDDEMEEALDKEEVYWADKDEMDEDEDDELDT